MVDALPLRHPCLPDPRLAVAPRSRRHDRGSYGPRRLRLGIEAIEAIRKREQLNSYYLLYATLGEFETRLDNRETAANYFRQALELVTIESEQTFLTKKLRELENCQKISRTQAAR